LVTVFKREPTLAVPRGRDVAARAHCMGGARFPVDRIALRHDNCAIDVLSSRNAGVGSHWGVTGIEQHLAAGELPRHRHRTAYSAIVIAGGYLERGDTGRWRLEAGDVVAHQAFEAHGDMIGRSGATVINIDLPAEMVLPAVFRVADPDALIRAARARSPETVALLEPVETRAPLMLDWPDMLALALRQAPVRLASWAAAMNLAPATVSRGFRAAYGTTPARYRADAQAQAALRLVMTGHEPLSQIAYDCAFADQAHLTRSITRLTGRPPASWRTRGATRCPRDKVKSVQDWPARWS